MAVLCQTKSTSSPVCCLPTVVNTRCPRGKEHSRGDPSIVKLNIAITTGYLISDLFLITYYWKAIGDKYFVIHHLAALYAYYFVLGEGILAYFGNFRLLAEFSTPFVNQRTRGSGGTGGRRTACTRKARKDASRTGACVVRQTTAKKISELWHRDKPDTYSGAPTGHASRRTIVTSQGPSTSARPCILAAQIHSRRTLGFQTVREWSKKKHFPDDLVMDILDWSNKQVQYQREKDSWQWEGMEKASEHEERIVAHIERLAVQCKDLFESLLVLMATRVQSATPMTCPETPQYYHMLQAMNSVAQPIRTQSYLDRTNIPPVGLLSLQKCQVHVKILKNGKGEEGG
ncbi:TLC domain-containing protein 4 isoform X2 [Pelodiscus sinensis]|uniref:TLC domain-containing protein 4 isoform X2 n=1 Tax=Pelodiscus sinensis TaxID=13735 RepID=UPI003F6BB442